MKKMIMLALLAGGTASPAFAQDGADPVNGTFTGPKIEVLGGFDGIGGDDDVEATGWTYGVGVGFDFAAGNLVAGVEAEATESSISECEEGDDDESACFGFDRDLYVGGRLGVLAGNSLFYVKGGYTNVKPSLELEGLDLEDVEGLEVFDDKLDGYRVGAGVEFAVAWNGYVKAEYRYSNYELGVTRHQGVFGLGFRF